MSPSSDEQRLAKLRAVWRAAAPDAPAIAAAYRRFKRRAPAGSRHWTFELVLGAAAAAALLLLLGRAQWPGQIQVAEEAQVSEARRHSAEPQLFEESQLSAQKLGVPALSVSGEHPAQTPGKGLWLERAGGIEPLAPGIQYSVDDGQTVAVVIDGERQVIAGPKFFELALEVDRASGFRLYVSEPRPEALPAMPRAAAESENATADVRKPNARALHAEERAPSPAHASEGSLSPVPGTDEHTSGWTRAARAMRNGDMQTAKDELEALSRSATGQSRDAAELTLAQIWLTEGAVNRARPVLARLSREGATAHVRRRASELLSAP